MPKEYRLTLSKLKQIQSIAESVRLTLDRQIEFDERVKGYLGVLIDDIEREGTEAED